MQYTASVLRGRIISLKRGDLQQQQQRPVNSSRTHRGQSLPSRPHGHVNVTGTGGVGEARAACLGKVQLDTIDRVFQIRSAMWLHAPVPGTRCSLCPCTWQAQAHFVDTLRFSRWP